ncbi:alcohol dehydrogenase catalytic domain-containing protein [Renibacterium salmoninarum]|uniref:alcohol dehydrogenase catalytic domain-containing protein n=1 Tax=Renibacterium salmoninarum TaxID=1646 RepID=UPI002D780EEF|nr:alcohol dehydrogenase catalytic domain-containing protein [Renibacterium salmoninarum]
MRIEQASLCHSDLSVVNGSRLRPLPMALGHEAAGVISALGEGVTDLSVGDQVVMVFVPACGSCRACAAGRPALCHRGAETNGSGDLLHGTPMRGRGSITTWAYTPLPSRLWSPASRWCRWTPMCPPTSPRSLVALR